MAAMVKGARPGVLEKPMVASGSLEHVVAVATVEAVRVLVAVARAQEAVARAQEMLVMVEVG